MNPKYTISGKLNAFDQLNIARKLSPALALVDGLVRKENSEKPKSVLTILMLSQLSDEDSTFVINKCLSTVLQQTEGASPSRLMSPNGILMDDFISMEDILDLTAKVIEVNLGDFLNTALPSLRQG